MAVKSMDEIATLLEAVKFKKRLLGGVDEDDVWRIMGRLQAEYRSLVDATEQRFGGLLDERNDMISKQQKEIAQLKAKISSTKRGDADG